MVARILFLVFANIIASGLCAQQRPNSKSAYLNAYKIFRIQDSKLDHENFFEAHKIKMGLGDEDKMLLVRSAKGKNGYRHYRYKQLYKGVEVEGVAYHLHSKNNKLHSANGSFLPLLDLDVVPKLSSLEALELALNDMGAETYSWQVSESSSLQRPVPKLMIMDKNLTSFSGHYHLAYKIDLHSTQPHDAQSYYIDANSGVVLKKITLLHTKAVPGKGKTKYLGEKSFVVDSLGPEQFRLLDPTRTTTGIVVYDGEPGNYFESKTSYFDLENEDLDEVAVDAHYLTSELYDYLIEEFDWTGLDNEDAAFKVVVHARDGADYVNAYWNGKEAWFGDGNCLNGPLVTAEVLGHEFMHGIVDYTSDLIYAGESGAINESMADVMGQYLEHKIEPDNFSWQLGNSFHLVDNLKPFRVLDDPESVNKPGYYRGDKWKDTNGVHTNSAIGNLMFVLLSDGGESTNEAGINYKVNGIGIEAATKFLFYVNRFFLGPNSDYIAYAEACFLASEMYFGGEPSAIEDVEQAWLAVGLPLADDFFDLKIDIDLEDRSCNWGSYLDISVSVKNLSKLAYEAIDSAYLELTANPISGQVEERFYLTDDILPGESIVVDFNDYVILDRTAILVKCELFAEDGADGNKVTEIVNTDEFNEHDLSLKVDLESRNCNNNELDIRIRIANETCKEVDPDQSILFTIEAEDSGDLIYSENLIVEEPILIDRTWIIHRQVDFGGLDSESYLCTLHYPLDKNFEDNTTELAPIILEPIVETYHNPFDAIEDLEKNIILISNSSQGNLYDHQDEVQFFATGSRTVARNPLCPLAEDNWIHAEENAISGNISAQLNTCLELDGMQAPVVEFDLIQHRNTFSVYASESTSAMLVTAEAGDFILSEVIEGQEEGLSETHRFRLPANYKGPLDLAFITLTGEKLDSEHFLSHDLVLMNDLRIYDGAVSIEELSNNSILRISPNPATDILSVNSIADLQAYKIYDMNGRMALSGRVDQSVFEIDIKELQQGCYTIVVVSRKNRALREKFIKIN